MRDHWNKREVALIVEDYFAMLAKEIGMLPLNKTQHRNILLSKITNRSAGSIEFKHQNISAALILMGLPFIAGYKPLYNFQRDMLVETIHEHLTTNSHLQRIFTSHADVIPEIQDKVNFNEWQSEPPKAVETEHRTTIRNPIKINYLERERSNAMLGQCGEALAFDYEKYVLNKIGKANLADQVEWISRDKGDGLGYDILSRCRNGKDKYIEVKTTKLGKEAPFYFSANEYLCAKKYAQQYHLYRIYDYAKNPKIFILKGDFETFCNIEAISYRGRF